MEAEPASGQSVQRYYDPMGRFLSVDPVTAYDDPIGAFHRYRYASNNPYKYVDPDGRQDGLAAHGAGVAIALRNNPEALARYARSEAAVSNISGDGTRTLSGVALGMAGTEFAQNGDYSKEAVGSAVVKIVILKKVYKPKARFTSAQKREIIKANRERNNGELRSDRSGDLLEPAQQSRSGVTPPSNEAHVDHIVPRAAGGTNDPANAQILSRAENLRKSDKIE